ncbi:hypothetical protein DENSPDRAFT_851834 [Dentipellis sp. KUC8613]|nr:hypothetical protein DENSPDRAFT_851834 [Dentipellis sp. KUC8613]
MSRKSKARKGSRDSLRDRYLARSRSQTDVAIQSPPAPSQPLETVPSAVAPSSQTGLYIAQDAAFFPSQPGPSLFIPYEEPVFTVSSPETLSEGVIGSSHNEVASGSASRTHARAQEKAARAASAPTVKHKITDEVRKKRAEKAKRKRGRDVDDRIRLNNVLPEDRRATLDPPGLVETMRKGARTIPACVIFIHLIFMFVQRTTISSS